jgi:precorrin-3B synthase
MSAAPVIQGWCPGALRPMPSGDGWVVRVRPRLGRVTQAQALGLAALAETHGNGIMDLSSRANLQLRGVTEASHPALVDGLRALGLVDGSVEAEARRNITLEPFWTPGSASHQVARVLEDMSIASEAINLPSKFGTVVDCGAVPVLRSVPADIRVERALTGLVVAADGMKTGAPVSVDTASEAVAELMRWFLEVGGSVGGRGRMRALLDRGARPPARFATTARLEMQAPAPGPGIGPQGAMVGLAFGQIRAGDLAALAAIGPLRTTPWRMLLIEGAVAMPSLAGLVTTPSDPLRRVVACTGAPGCLQALQPTRDLARHLAPSLPEGMLLHVSGCAKGCAHPAVADMVLVATEAGFDLIRNGKADAPAILRGLTAPQLETSPELLHGSR